MADAVVVSKIVFEGENRAGKAIKEAEEQAGKLGQSLKGAADKSGDLERGVLGLRDIVGGVGGPLGDVADKFGGIEGVLKGLPGMLGPIALAAAAVAAGVSYYYAQAEENRKKALQAQQAELELIGQSTSELAKRAGLDASLVVAAEQRLTVEQAQAKVAQDLSAANSAQIALLKAMEGQDQVAIANARTLLGLKQQQVQVSGYLVEEASRSQIAAAQTKAAQLDAILIAQREELEISRIADTRQRTDEQAIRLRKQLLETEHQLNSAAAERVRLQISLSVMTTRGVSVAERAKVAKQLDDATNRQLAAANKQIDLENKLIGIKKEADADAANRANKRMQQVAKAAAMQQKAEQERQRQMQETDRVSKELADKALARINAYGRELAMQIKWEKEAAASLAESYTLLEDARIDAASPEERQQLEYLRERKRLTQELVGVQRDMTRGAQDAANRQAALLMRLDTLDKKKNAEQQARAQKQADERINLGFQIADSAVSALAMVEGAELAAAGVKATLAVAEGLYAVAKSGPAGIPQLIAGIAAAAQFALAAGSSAPSVPTMGGGGGQSLAPQSTADTRPITINVQGAIIGTPQQVGQSITKAVKSLKGTGYTAKAGA